MNLSWFSSSFALLNLKSHEGFTVVKRPSLRRTRWDAKRLVLFVVVKGCFAMANPRDSKGLMGVRRREGFLCNNEFEGCQKFRPLFTAVKNFFVAEKGLFIVANP